MYTFQFDSKKRFFPLPTWNRERSVIQYHQTVRFRRLNMGGNHYEQSG